MSDNHDVTSLLAEWAERALSGVAPELTGSVSVRQASLTGKSGRASCAPYEKDFLHRRGHRVHVVVGGAGFPDSGGGVTWAVDISERKLADAQVARELKRVREQRADADVAITVTPTSSRAMKK